ncbi:hypothetical protein N657DRAFT_595284 [Parathielavia appendiculata]|uniref:Uncharacterized protein n=1 Tax=Parathielavia appendiculata TaxID=2587402 RepID=A0AAN6U258_9PEZI|nr:hypothetical protein N657DRAFT_595284 [Parathielavia appendiculata]
MKLSSILFSSAAFGSALSQTIQLPELPDGSYIMSLDDDGKLTWTDITANVTSSPAPAIPKRDAAGSSSRIHKRFNWPSGTYPWCPGGDWFLLTDFYDHGWDAFYATCAAGGGYKFPRNTVLTEYQGTSVSYMCAYTTNPCNVNEWVDAVNWAAGNCHGRSNGWMEPGYLHVPAWNKRYGYAKAGSSIC